MGSVTKFEALNRRLDSWKEIAGFFGCDERTVKRWEKERGLPVHRLPGIGRGKVFAYSDELSDWLKGPRLATLPARSDLIDGPRSGSDLGIPDLGFPDLGTPDPESRPADKSPESGNEPSESPGTSSRAVQITSHAALYEAVVGTPAAPGTRKVWFFALPILALILAAFFLHPTSPAASSSTELAVQAGARRAANPEAEDFYLKGRFYWGKRTAESLNQAVDYFTQAIVHDPNYAPAYVGLADCYNLLREFSAMPDIEAYPRALSAAKKAVELDDTLAEAHRSLAFGLYYWNWDVPASEREYQRAIELDPNDATVHQWHGNALSLQGSFSEAIVELDRARKLDSSSRSILADYANALFAAGQPQQAADLLKQMEASDPEFISPHTYLAWMYDHTRDFPNYLSESRKIATLLNDKDTLALADAEEKSFAAGGEPALLQTMAHMQETLFRQNHGSAYRVASAYARLNRKQEALHFLQLALDQREIGMLLLPRDPDFSGLRADPAFRDLLAKVGPRKP